jgi:hypothetical protein
MMPLPCKVLRLQRREAGERTSPVGRFGRIRGVMFRRQAAENETCG